MTKIDLTLAKLAWANPMVCCKHVGWENIKQRTLISIMPLIGKVYFFEKDDIIDIFNEIPGLELPNDFFDRCNEEKIIVVCKKENYPQVIDVVFKGFEKDYILKEDEIVTNFESITFLDNTSIEEHNRKARYQNYLCPLVYVHPLVAEYFKEWPKELKNIVKGFIEKHLDYRYSLQLCRSYASACGLNIWSISVERLNKLFYEQYKKMLC